MNHVDLNALQQVLLAHDNVLVTAHAHPDGDAVGSCAAMGFVLKGLGKRVTLYNATPFPEYLNWLELPAPVCQGLDKLPFEPDLVVALDSGNTERLGEDMHAWLGGKRAPAVVNIDHHQGNTLFGTAFNWANPDMAATGLMVGLLAEHLGPEFLRGPAAVAVYTARVSDTGSFGFGNTSAAALHMAAQLVEAGLNVAEVRARLDNQWSLAKFHLWGRLMSAVELLEDGQVAACTVSDALLAEVGAQKEDLEGMVEQLRRLKGSRVAVLARESAQGVKISLRSFGADNVRLVAEVFGGGGHNNAAGATLRLPLDQALPALLPHIHKILCIR